MATSSLLLQKNIVFLIVGHFIRCYNYHGYINPWVRRKTSCWKLISEPSFCLSNDSIQVNSATSNYIHFSTLKGGINKWQKDKNIFRKISVQGNEVEIFEEQENSYFDKYLNEVLYLFKNVGSDVIVTDFAFCH